MFLCKQVHFQLPWNVRQSVLVLTKCGVFCPVLASNSWKLHLTHLSGPALKGRPKVCRRFQEMEVQWRVVAQHILKLAA